MVKIEKGAQWQCGRNRHGVEQWNKVVELSGSGESHGNPDPQEGQRRPLCVLLRARRLWIGSSRSCLEDQE